MTERTPAGGDRSDIIYLDANGNRTDNPDQATAAEIREYVGNIMIARTYMERDTMETLPKWTPPGDVLAEPDVADTAKNTWSVFNHDADGMVHLATTVETLLSAVGEANAPVEQQRAFLLNLMTLPSWQAAPAELKQDVAHWLVRNS